MNSSIKYLTVIFYIWLEIKHVKCNAYFTEFPVYNTKAHIFPFNFMIYFIWLMKMSTWLTKISTPLHIKSVIKIAIINLSFCDIYVEIIGSYISWLCFLLLCGFNECTWAIRFYSKHMYLLSCLWCPKGLTFKALYKVASLMRISLNIINYASKSTFPPHRTHCFMGAVDSCHTQTSIQAFLSI